MNSEIKHVRLSNHATDAVKQTDAIKAADAIADAGGSPRAQIEAAREASGKRLTYTSHQGARQRARALARMKQGENASLCEDEGCPQHGTTHVCINRSE